MSRDPIERRGIRMLQLPPLPWGESDLAPHISQETISFHYGKHHKAYVDNANKMLEGGELANAPLDDRRDWRTRSRHAAMGPCREVGCRAFQTGRRGLGARRGVHHPAV